MITPNIGTNVKDGESPLYTSGSSNPPYISTIIPLAQAQGSGLDSDMVDGFDAVSAYVRGPNKLIATTSDGKLATETIATGDSPGNINTKLIPALIIGTLAFLKAQTLNGFTLGFATDIGTAGAFYAYFNTASVGDGGWVFVTGS